MKNIQELEEALLVKQGIIPASHAIGTVEGIGVDTKDFDTLMADLNIGVISATGTLDVHLEESDELATGYTDITGAVFSQKTVTDNSKISKGRLKCKNFKRFVRVVAVIATDVADAGVVLNLGKFDGLAKVVQDITPEFALDYVSDGGTEGSEAT